MLRFIEDRHRKSNIKNHNNNKSMKIENTVKALSHEKCDNFFKLSLLLREYIFFLPKNRDTEWSTRHILRKLGCCLVARSCPTLQ